MTTFLFWNINKKPIQALITNLALQHDVDVIMLAESQISPSTLIKTLNKSSQVLYDYSPQIGCKKIELYTKFSRSFIPAIYEDHRLTIRNLELPGSINILLAITHFPSKNNWSNASQTSESFNLSNAIKQAESLVGHSKTVLVGDLNMNPFDDGVVSATGLHGVMSRTIAKRRTRIVQKRKYPFFYNPMWNLLGDYDSTPPGTYYYSNSEHLAYFWHNFDQVLIRPDLLDTFNNRDIKIISSVKGESLLNSEGKPDRRRGSDHLPIIFKLQL